METLSIEQFVQKKNKIEGSTGGEKANGALSIEDFSQLKSAETVSTTPEKNKGSLIQSFAQGITNVPRRLVANVAGILASANPEQYEKIRTEGVDYGYLGKAKPVGVSGDFKKDIKDVFGTGIEAASFLPVARVPAIGKQILSGTVKEGLKRGALEGAFSGATAGVGSEIQKTDSTLPSIAKSGVIGAGIGTVAGGALGAGLGAVPSIQASRAITRQRKVEDTVNRVLQGDTKDIKTGIKAISQVDFDGVKTYKDALERVGEQIGTVARKLDDTFDTDKTPRLLDTLSSATDVNGQVVKKNYVKDALNQLENYYNKTNNIAESVKIQQLRQKASTQGLTVGEINDVARLHGKDLSGYNISGELASGLSKQAAENTRKGVKETARTLFGNKVAKQADEELTNLIRVRDLFQEMTEKVNDIEKKIITGKLPARVVRFVIDNADILTGGALKSMFRSLTLSRGQGQHLANALDLEKQLSKNLNFLKKALASDASEKTIIDSLEEYIKSVSTKPLLQLPERSSVLPKKPTLYGTPKGKITPNLQEAVDVVNVESGKIVPTKGNPKPIELKRLNAPGKNPILLPLKSSKPSTVTNTSTSK